MQEMHVKSLLMGLGNPLWLCFLYSKETLHAVCYYNYLSLSNLLLTITVQIQEAAGVIRMFPNQLGSACAGVSLGLSRASMILQVLVWSKCSLKVFSNLMCLLRQVEQAWFCKFSCKVFHCPVTQMCLLGQVPGTIYSQLDMLWLGQVEQACSASSHVKYFIAL